MMNNQDLSVLMEHLNDIKNWYHYHHDYTSISEILDGQVERTAWAKEHLKGKWHNYFSLWYFEKEDDYLLFLMRWS